MKRVRVYVSYADIEEFVKTKLDSKYADKDITLINVENSAEERDINLMFSVTLKDNEYLEEVYYTEVLTKTNSDTNEKQVFIDILD